MTKIRFHINTNKEDKNGLVPIRAKIAIDSTARYKVIEKVKKRYWNSKKQRVSPNRESEPYNRHREINKLLDNYENKATNYFNDLVFMGMKIDLRIVENFLNGKLIETEKKDFWKAYDSYLKSGELEKSYNTNRNRKTIYNKLKDFETDSGYSLTFQSLDLEFWDDLKDYILVEKEHGYNYLAAIAAKLKAFMTWAAERNYHTNMIYKKFSAPEKEISIIHLTFEELQQLINFKFDSKKHSRSRDFFCFGCLTGLRFVDLERLTKDNVSNKTLRLTTQKTNKAVAIPIYEGLQTIIDRYPDSYRLLPKYTNQRINEYIKECCELAKITAMTEYKTFKKNETITDFRPKHELISSHTGRKTFINLAYENGMDIEMIKSITGITREKTLRRYLQVSEKAKMEKLTKAFENLNRTEIIQEPELPAGN